MILKALGAWLDVNGEAIYATTVWSTFGEGPTTVSTGHISEASDKPFTAEDIRFTAKDDSVYATILEWPESGTVTIRSLAEGSPHWPGEIKSVELLGSKERIIYARTDAGLRVDLPKKKPCACAYVLKLR